MSRWRRVGAIFSPPCENWHGADRRGFLFRRGRLFPRETVAKSGYDIANARASKARWAALRHVVVVQRGWPYHDRVRTASAPRLRISLCDFAAGRRLTRSGSDGGGVRRHRFYIYARADCYYTAATTATCSLYTYYYYLRCRCHRRHYEEDAFVVVVWKSMNPKRRRTVIDLKIKRSRTYYIRLCINAGR